MPVVRRIDQVAEDLRTRLVSRLADELAIEGTTAKEPLIFENPIGGSDRFFAIVIWSEWALVPWSQRSDIIFDAYRLHDDRHTGNARAQRLAIASGMTWDEADAEAFFPFSISPNVRSAEIGTDQIRNLMLEESGFETPTGIRLRFMTQQEAERVWRRLHDKLPNAHWSINRVVNRIRVD